MTDILQHIDETIFENINIHQECRRGMYPVPEYSGERRNFTSKSSYPFLVH